MRVLGKGWVGEGLVGGGRGRRRCSVFRRVSKFFCIYKIKNCKNNCKMWRIGNCFLSAPVHIPPNEIPHQTPGSH